MCGSLLPDGIELKPFRPCLYLIPGLNLLIYLGEDVSTVDSPVVRHRYHDWDLLRHSYQRRFVGVQFWLSYSPQRLLPPPR